MAKKLLVVDSNLAIQKLVEYNLSREQFEVTCLNDGLSALDLLATVDPDLILADYHLEGISFTRFCEKVKQKQTAKERPILVLVGAMDSYDPNKLVSLGVVDSGDREGDRRSDDRHRAGSTLRRPPRRLVRYGVGCQRRGSHDDASTVVSEGTNDPV